MSKSLSNTSPTYKIGGTIKGAPKQILNSAIGLPTAGAAKYRGGKCMAPRRVRNLKAGPTAKF